MPGNNNISSLFDRSGNLTLRAMENYLKGELGPEEKSAVDKHLEGSPFDREALEGLKKSADIGIEAEVEELNAAIRSKAYETGKRNLSARVKWQYWSAAATIIIVFGLSIIMVFIFRNTTEENQMAVFQADTLVEEEQRTSGIKTDDGIQAEEVPALAAAEPIEQEDHPGPGSEDEELVKLEPYVVENIPPVPETSISLVETEVDAVESPEEVPVGGVADKDYSGRAIAGTERKTKATYTIQAEQAVKAARKAEEDGTAEGFQPLDSQAQFPGDTLVAFITKHLKYPPAAADSGIEGRVFVSFVVEEDGSITNVEVIHGIGGGCDEEAVRVFKMMPKWIPARKNGEPIKDKLLIPIMFKRQATSY